MYRIVKLRAKEHYQLEIEFEDGTCGTVDMTDRLFGPVFEPLRDRHLFDQVYIDEFGAPCWPNGADLAPDALHATLSGQNRPAALQTK